MTLHHLAQMNIAPLVAPGDDPRVIVNLSVWETPEHLRAFFRDRLDHLAANGPTDHAFTLGKVMPPPGVPKGGMVGVIPPVTSGSPCG